MPVTQPAEPDQPTTDTAVETLLATVNGGSNFYFNVIVTAVLVVGIHALLPFGTLSGVLLNDAMSFELGLSPEQIVVGDSLVFAFWIPGALVGGPLSDRFGRKAALVGFGLANALAIASTSLVPFSGELQLLTSRALTGFTMGAFIAPAFNLLVESSDPAKRGAAGTRWVGGYVGGCAVLSALHLATISFFPVDASALSGVAADIPSAGVWRGEELLLAAWVLLFTGLSQSLLVESPRYLFASGRTLDALDAARTIGRTNGVDLDAALIEDARLAPLRDAAYGCYLSEMDEAEGEEDGDAEPTPMELACVEPAEAEAKWSDLIAPDGLLWTSLALGGMEIAYNLGYYALIFSSGKISDAVLVNIILLAAADIPGAVLSGRSIDNVGAKETAYRFLLSAGSILVLLAALTGLREMMPPDAGSAAEAVFSGAEVTLSLMGKSAATGSFTAIFLLFAELYPTRLRGSALGLGMMFGKAGATAAPLIVANLALSPALGLTGAGLFGAAAVASTLEGAKEVEPTDDDE